MFSVHVFKKVKEVQTLYRILRIHFVFSGCAFPSFLISSAIVKGDLEIARYCQYFSKVIHLKLLSWTFSSGMFIVVDDAVSIVRLIKWKLEKEFGKGVGVTMIGDGKLAVETFKQLLLEGRHSVIDAILMDHHMPEMSGLDAITHIRNLEREHEIEYLVPIIGFSADISDEMNTMLLEGGANYLVAKPPEPGELEQLCAEIMKKKKEHTALNGTYDP